MIRHTLMPKSVIPADSRLKRLRVDYTLDGAAASETVGENRKLTISGNPR
jgi:hypothetical protein